VEGGAAAVLGADPLAILASNMPKGKAALVMSTVGGCMYVRAHAVGGAGGGVRARTTTT